MDISTRPAPAPRLARVGGGGNHLGALRLIAAVPAILGSGAVLVVLCAPLGGWTPLVLAGWSAVVPVLSTRVGERVAVAVSCRFHTLCRDERAALGPAWQSACRAAGFAAEDARLYRRRDEAVNAFAVGWRSVAVTTGAVAALRAGRLDVEQLRAVLLHELGHLVTGAVRYGLVAAWLAWPWRLARRLVLSLCLLPVVRRQPRALLACVVAVGVVVAVTQSVQHGHLAAAALLAAVALCAVLCPLLDAWVARRGELAADCFAASAGVGPALATVLASIEARGDGWAPRMLRRHPPLARRAVVLNRPAATPPAALPTRR